MATANPTPAIPTDPPADPTTITPPVDPPTDPPIVEDVTGLKSALEAERKARKEADKVVAKMLADSSKATEADLEKNKQFEELLNLERDKNLTLNGLIEKSAMDAFLTLAVNKLTKDEKKGNILKDQMRNNIKYEDGAVIITGLAEVETNEQLADHFKTEYSFLIDESLASGGGATGNRSGGATQNIKTQEQFDNLSDGDKMQFHLKGGQIKS